MNIQYVNHLNEKVNLNSEHIILQYQELFDYSWDSEISNGRITSFYRDNGTIPITITVTADNDKEYVDILNQFHSIISKDIFAISPGKLYIGEQYLNCYISGDIKEDAFMGVPIQIKNLTVVTDHPFWITEHPYYFKMAEAESTGVKRYAYRYAYRYANGLRNTAIVNEHYTDCNFRMIIYGPITDPLVYIGGHEYLVNIILESGEYLEIDSAEETVTKVTAFGERVNAFNNRNFASSVFEPIHPGRQNVGWSGRFDFDLRIYEERSEPKWQ